MKKILIIHKNSFEKKALLELCQNIYEEYEVKSVEIKMSSINIIHKFFLYAIYLKLKEIYISVFKIIDIEANYLLYITPNPAIRLAAIFKKKKMILYLRNIHFSTQDQSISDKISSSIIGKILPKLFNSQYSDQYLVSHEVNSKYLFKRVSPLINYINIGWYPKITYSNEKRKNIVYFISASFKHHGMMYSDALQVLYAKEISEFCALNNLTFIVRVHPNDDESRYNFSDIDKTEPDVYLKQLIPGDIIITVLSSLIYEVREGVKIVVYSNYELDKYFNDYYKENQIQALGNVNLITKEIQNV